MRYYVVISIINDGSNQSNMTLNYLLVTILSNTIKPDAREVCAYECKKEIASYEKKKGSCVIVE